jgi:hypothetical protein
VSGHIGHPVHDWPQLSSAVQRVLRVTFRCFTLP